MQTTCPRPEIYNHLLLVSRYKYKMAWPKPEHQLTNNKYLSLDLIYGSNGTEIAPPSPPLLPRSVASKQTHYDCQWIGNSKQIILQYQLFSKGTPSLWPGSIGST